MGKIKSSMVFYYIFFTSCTTHINHKQPEGNAKGVDTTGEFSEDYGTIINEDKTKCMTWIEEAFIQEQHLKQNELKIRGIVQI